MSVYQFGRNPSPPDKRDYKLAQFIQGGGSLNGSKAWAFNAAPLDQGDTPHCGGFAIANFGINEPIADPFGNADGHRFYDACKVVDREPGQQNGTCIRSAAKVMVQEDMIDAYAFARAVAEITFWLLNKGPVIVGTDWTESMLIPDGGNVVAPLGKVIGGHAYLLNEVREEGYYGIQNSWNGFWGKNGKAFIRIEDFAKLLYNGGEALAAVEVPQPVGVSSGSGCSALIASFLKQLTAKK